jgi:hypothetical protein
VGSRRQRFGVEPLMAMFAVPSEPDGLTWAGSDSTRTIGVPRGERRITSGRQIRRTDRSGTALGGR